MDIYFQSAIAEAIQQNNCTIKIDRFDTPPDNPNSFVFGSLQLIKRLKYLGYTNNYLCNLDNFRYTAYVKYFYQWMLNVPFTVIRYDEIIQYSNELFLQFGIDNTIFIRPDDGDKPFTGTILNKETLVKDLELLTVFETDYKDKLCIISYPQQYNLFNEYRIWIMNDKIITSSSYRINGDYETESIVPQKIIDYVQNILYNTTWRPDRGFVIDVVEFNNKIHIVELNSFSCSGIYNADFDKLVRSIIDEYSR